MRRITRSSKRSSNLPDQIKEEEIISSSASDSELEDINHVQKDLSNAQAGVVSLLNELKLLRKKNEELVEELTNYQEIEKVSKKKSTNAALQQQVKQLKDDARNLEKFRARDRAKIEKYKAKEIQHDAVDLKEPTDQDIEDTTHRMRKLLRQFHDLMTINVLDKEEDCPICLEPMMLKKCSSLPCQHIVCNECLPKICKVDWKLRSEEEQGLEVTKCPHCREEKPRTEVELVHYSPDQQFDELLEVAQEWARIDRRGMYETSEEEDEEDFLNDKSTDASATASSEASVPKEGTTSKESTPDSDISVSRAETPAMEERSQTRYVDSPVADKRKRMEELAAQRSRKKRR